MYELLAIPITILIIIYTYYQWCFQYWKTHNLPYLPGTVPFGSIENPITRKLPYYARLKDFYDDSKSKGYKHAGVYLMMNPRYLPIHPEYIKNVMSKDFDHFVDRGLFFNERDDPLSNHLFNMEGEKWRKLRAKLTPTFTSGKIKGMLDILLSCTEPLKLAVDEIVSKNEAVDIKEVAGCFTTDVIGSVAFGLECNSFKDPDSPFRTFGKKIFKVNVLDILKFLFWIMYPAIGKFLRFTLTPRDVHDFFMGTVEKTVAYREANNVTRKDFMQILLGLKNDAPDGEAITVTEIAAQAFVFFAAGFETSSATMQFCLFELAQDEVIQKRVREEIWRVLKQNDGKFTYEAINEMKYMNMVIEETLRKYPTLPILNRTCTKEYKVPDCDLILPKDMKVIIPVYGLHHDPEFFPEPQKFNPERFSEGNRHSIVPFTYLPFGDGPRICIGKRFGLIQTKVGLAAIIQNYHIKLNEKTVLPFELDQNNGFLLTSKHKIYLDMEKVEQENV